MTTRRRLVLIAAAAMLVLAAISSAVFIGGRGDSGVGEIHLGEDVADGVDYELSDGTVVHIDPYEPLPEEVKQDIAKPVSAAASQVPGDEVITLAEGERHPADLAYDAAAAAAFRASEETGKMTIVVYRTYGAMDDDSDDYQWLWVTTNGSAMGPDKDTVVAQAWEFVSSEPTPELWEVVVAE